MARVLPFAPVGEAPPAPTETRHAKEPLGKLLLRNGALRAEDLDRALNDQKQQDQKLGRILVAEGLIEGSELTRALSHQSGFGELDLAVSPPDYAHARTFNSEDCIRLEAIPWRQVGGVRVIATADPESANEIIEVFGSEETEIAIAIAQPDAIRDAIAETFSDDLRDAAIERCPNEFSCREWARGRRWALLGAVAGIVIAALAYVPLLAFQALILWIIVINSLTIGLRAVALQTHLRRTPMRIVEPTTNIAEYRKLPQISVIVPLLREEAVAKQLVEALEAMNYPPALLDIKLVLEEDDEITRAAIAQAELPPNVDVISVPTATLKTKPRAMNYALPFCHGEIVGVYDAEDRPDREQLRAVVKHLGAAPPDVACVQGFLDFYNTDRNWLSRCFTMEYAIWFRVILKGVQRLRIPIPLGGTTVFFRREALEKVGAWDAFNVTEDADLGMRLARFGMRCEMINSTTLEEANFRVWPWIKQRSRWLKGYAITWASHMRNPVQLFRDLGPRGFLGFQVLFLGAISSYLSIPLFWIAWGATFGLGLSIWSALPFWLVASFFVSMAIGSTIMITIAVLAARELDRNLIKWVPVLFLYWPLGAIAAYRAIGELFTKPFYWHKTEHGVSSEQSAEQS